MLSDVPEFWGSQEVAGCPFVSMSHGDGTRGPFSSAHNTAPYCSALSLAARGGCCLSADNDRSSTSTLSQEQIQQQLERLKQLRQSGEQQGSQGAEQMESLLVRHSHLQEAGRGQCQAGL